MKKWLCLFIFFFLFVSCVPKLEKPPDLDIDTPQNWTSDKETTEGTISQWWTAFNDPGLNRAIEVALKENYNLKSAAARVDAAVALARIAGADLYPQVGLGLSGSRRKQNFVGFPFGDSDDGVPNVTSNLFGVSLNLSWEIDLWGRIRAGKAAAVADFEATAADYMGFQLSLIGQTAKAWFASVEAEQQVQLADATLENYRTTNDQVHRRYRLGLRPSLDVRLSESNVADAEALLFLRKNQRQSITRQLEMLVGRYPSGNIELSSSLSPELKTVPAGLPADIVKKRPDLIAAEKRLASSYARVIESKRALYPRISLTASGGTSTNELKNLLNGDFSVWNLIGNLLQPIFQGGKLRAGVDLAKARELEILALYAQSVLNAYSEVETALEAEGLLAEREKALQTAVDQAIAARNLAQNRYARGLTGLIEVLESQRQAFLSQSQLLIVKRQRLDNRIDLYLALGGSFMDHESLGKTALTETSSNE
ncbi:efflux transporter outer membrane subunit [Acidobacteriota bacterium]